MEDIFSRFATFHLFMSIGIVFFLLGSARILPYSSRLRKKTGNTKDCSKVCLQTSILWGVSITSIFLALAADSNGLEFTLNNFPGILMFCGFVPGIIASISLFWGLKISTCR